MNKINYLSETHPNLLLEWHHEKNKDISPQSITSGSSKKVWWICKERHEWEAVIKNRVKGTKCPYCSNQKILAGYNDLQTHNPKLATEWHPTKNGDLTPNKVSKASSRKVWWICPKGHEWESSINHRTNNRGCPYCSNKKLLSGYNDLATTNPKLAEEWHPIKNKLLASEIIAGNNNKAWWICPKGHEWEAQINSRNRGNGCPYCAGQKVSKENSLEQNDELKQQWHPTKNKKLTSKDFTVHSGMKVWWQCEKGHEWKASIDNRTKGRTCPYCSNKKVLTGYNDLLTTNPILAKQWHPTKNIITPKEVTMFSNKKVWWICPKGHEWQSTVSNRQRTDCPYCCNRKILVGYNDLATTNPELLQEWHPTKNIDLSPLQISYGSQKKVWWICSKGHEWQSTVSNRTWGNGCPKCKESKGEKRIEQFLIDNSIQYTCQYRIDDCYYKNPLPFDFAIFKNNQLHCLIEYDGEQHFQVMSVFGGRKGFELTQKRDEIKTSYCQSNNIQLLRIPYWDYNNIEKILIDFLKH